MLTGTVSAMPAISIPTLPTITLLAPVSGSSTTYARNAVVLADYVCTDADSGVATCQGTVADGAAIDTATAGDKTFEVLATDNAGNSNRAEVVYTVVRSTPVVTWATPASVPHGTALGDAQLNAIADVAGTFLYSPAAGTVLDAGQRPLAVTFTPDDQANYYTAPKVVTLTVTPVTPTLTWAAPAPITYGTPLPASVLAAAATSPVTQAAVPGTFQYLGPCQRHPGGRHADADRYVPPDEHDQLPHGDDERPDRSGPGHAVDRVAHARVYRLHGTAGRDAVECNGDRSWVRCVAAGAVRL